MARLFVALRPPRTVRDTLLSAQGGVEGARWQDDDQLHLTLRFVGEVDRQTGDDLLVALSAIMCAPFVLEAKGSGHFEKRGRANALWAGLAPSLGLAALQRKVEHACRAAGLQPEPRTFVPHITLARLGRGSRGAGDWLVRHGDLAAPSWPVRAFRLYESVLHPDGTRYTPIAEWPLLS